MIDKKIWLLVGAVLLVPIFLNASEDQEEDQENEFENELSYIDTPNLPSGMRKNNPGNIRSGTKPWQGQINVINNFVVFQTWLFGIRAMIKLLINYMTYGVGSNPCSVRPQKTIKDIIETWAPRYSCGGDNSDAQVDKYINYVSNRTGFKPLQVLTTDRDTLKALVQAMSFVEQGRECVSDEQFNKAYNLL